MKSDQLGMPFGIAQNRLRKLIMFSLVQKCNQDTCFKCGDKIQTPEELSVEHKEPWLHVSADLFWDLNNIAFSHLKCNRPNRPGGNPYGGQKGFTEYPEGYSWCSDCKTLKEVDCFHKSSSARNGINQRCKPCNSLNNKKNYQKRKIRAGVV